MVHHLFSMTERPTVDVHSIPGWLSQIRIVKQTVTWLAT